MTITGQRIRQKRLELNLTMEELGQKLGVQKSAVNKWEKGETVNIKRECLAKMAELFDVSPVWLMGFENAPDVTVTYSAPGKETVTTMVDNKSKPIIGETAMRVKLYQAALNVPAPCLEVAIQLLNSLAVQTHEVFTCSEKCCHMTNKSIDPVDGYVYETEKGSVNVDKSCRGDA